MRLHIIFKQSYLLLAVFLWGCTATPPTTQNHGLTSVRGPDNCEVGCPTGGSTQTVIRDVYTLNNNSSTKFANWVAYKITKTSQASNRARNWKADPDLPASDTLPPAAYQNANKLLAVDRGHQAPLASLGGNTDWQALNYLSNITPQKAALNQGAWSRLEDQERALANRSDVSAVYSVTGPLFEKTGAALPARPDVIIPDAYWKIIFIGTRPDKGKYAAFLLKQSTPKNASFCDYQVTVNTIEQQTNPKLTIWSALPQNIAEMIKKQKGTLAQEMGCP
ncbi:endonuclease [Superficieibacter electus]|uniref:Endonuclease n=1 Tax=Superficieibacter electus TaxID=2022662 RepID=A0A2P5GQB5_9ENTR|nr:DNA/RNA non-specific endonuclease [Superficieibacter electus]POP45568.1 endonuclease [Superficieibacter electus]POP48729.1 endonuclease [Superficieibacter electus]